MIRSDVSLIVACVLAVDADLGAQLALDVRSALVGRRPDADPELATMVANAAAAWDRAQQTYGRTLDDRDGAYADAWAEIVRSLARDRHAVVVAARAGGDLVEDVEEFLADECT